MPLLRGCQLRGLNETVRRRHHAPVSLRLGDICEHLVRLKVVAVGLYLDTLEVFCIANDVRLVYMHGSLVVRCHNDGQACRGVYDTLVARIYLGSGFLLGDASGVNQV